MHRLNLLISILALGAIASCGTPPTAQEMRQAHYGSYPSDYRTQIDTVTDGFHDRLGDPFQVSAVTKPRKDWMGNPGHRTWGYSCEVRYQAPNPEVNATTYFYRAKVFFKNKKIVAVTNTTNVGDVFGSALVNSLSNLNGQAGGDDAGEEQPDDGSQQ